MNTMVCTCAALAIAGAAAAQTGPAPQQPPAKVEFSTWIQNQHRAMKMNLLQAAEKMSDADYTFRPAGAAAEVRTYAMLIGHLANANNQYCALARGDNVKTRPMIGTNENSGNEKAATMSKADLVKALNDALAYCDAGYDQLTDANAMEMIKAPGGNNTTREVTRAQFLVANLAHNNEHYGNIVTYLRAKGLVPPSTERAQPRRQ